MLLILLPLLLPVVMSVFETLLPSRHRDSPWVVMLRMLLYLATSAFVLVVPANSAAVLSIQLGVADVLPLRPLALNYTRSGIVLSMLYCIASSLSSPVGFTVERSRRRRVLTWLITAVVVLCSLGNNIYTLCLAWTLLAGTLFAYEMLDEQRRILPLWVLVMQLFPIVLLAAVAVITAIQQRQDSFSDLVSSPTLVAMLVSAAFLRMTPFPLPGYTRRNWLSRSSTLCVGMSLFLKITSLSAQALPGWRWLVPVLIVCSLVPALLANLVNSADQRHTYLYTSLVALALIAPLISPVEGTGVTILYCVLIFTVFQVPVVGNHLKTTLRHVTMVLTRVSNLILMGLPLSLGLLTRWELQRLMVGIDQQGASILLAVTYLLLTLGLWRAPGNGGSKIPGREDETAFPSDLVCWTRQGLYAALLGVVILLGFAPGLINNLLPLPIAMPTLSGLFAGGIKDWIFPMVTALVIPFAGAFFIMRLGSYKLSENLYFIYRILRFDWFYQLIGSIIRLGSDFLQDITLQLEGRYLLVWHLAWLMFIIVMVGGS